MAVKAKDAADKLTDDEFDRLTLAELKAELAKAKAEEAEAKARHAKFAELVDNTEKELALMADESRKQ